MTKQEKNTIQPLNLRPGTCFACYGDGGQRIANYVDQNDNYFESEWLDCACCDGSGNNCARCWPKTAK